MVSPRERFSSPVASGPPGEVGQAHVRDHEDPNVTVFAYGPDTREEGRDVGIEEALTHVGQAPVTWINVDGLGDLELLETLWDELGIHPLVREDIVNAHQRPKFEAYEGQGFLALQMVRLVDDQLHVEQVSIVFGADWIASFQVTQGDVFDDVRERIRVGRQRLRRAGPDYLAYSLLDAAVDGFFPVLERLGERVEALETEAMDDPSPDTIHAIHELKREYLIVRRALWPLREAVNAMQRSEGSPLIADETRTFLRDVYDHIVRVMDMVETDRELTSSLADVYYSTLSHRGNEVMKVLTIVATIFIPLTFIAGIYGMNFAPEVSPWNMPELTWAYGYPAVLALMLLVALGMLAYIRRRGWL